MVFVSKIIVGIAGAGRRTGCTHTGIVIANFLRDRKQPVAFLEMDGKGTFETIRTAYRTENFEDGFTLNGVDFFPQSSGEKLKELSGRSYNFYLLDFGDYALADQELFQKCDVKILCSGIKPWETVLLEKFFRELDEESLQKCNFCFFGAGAADSRKLKKEISGQMEPLKNLWFPEYVDDPFSCATLPEGAEIFDGYLEGTTGKKKRKKFGHG